MPKVTDKKTTGKGMALRPRRTVRAHLLPYPEYPLFPHATGRWAKKVREKLHFFGRWDGEDGTAWQQALELYQLQIDDLRAGRRPRTRTDGLTLRELVNRFLTTKRHLVDTSELTPRTFADYHATCARVLEVFGKGRLVVDLAADDFERLRKAIAKTYGPVALGNEIQRCRVLFKYAYDSGLIDRPVRYGQTFKRPNKKTLRLVRNEKGLRMFEADELRRLIAKAAMSLKAMILLGINAGFGNHDVATLPITALDLKGGWVNYPRPKTAIKRRCKLWPETIAAIEVALKARPAAREQAAEGMVFVTKYGKCWAKSPRLSEDPDAPNEVKANVDNPVTKETRKLLDKLKMHRPGLGFYALRHTFETVAGESKDQVAVDSIMGHSDPSMAAVYRERISDERLVAVSKYVRDWLATTDRPEQAPDGGWTIEPAPLPTSGMSVA
jgi:integrase